MMLDNYHGLFGVLKYNNIALPFEVINNVFQLKSAVFVPFLFGLAGFIMSMIQLILGIILSYQ